MVNKPFEFIKITVNFHQQSLLLEDLKIYLNDYNIPSKFKLYKFQGKFDTETTDLQYSWDFDKG